MRCKKHPADLSSSVGVCASCLRDRLLAIIAAQVQQDTRRGDPHLPPPPPPLVFPRSVSPYISRRKSDIAADAWSQLDGRHRLFYSTPQVGPTGSVKVGAREGTKRRKGGRFSAIIRSLFRSRSDKMDFGTDPGITPPDPCSDSPSWFSSIIPRRRTLTAEYSSRGQTQKATRNRDRGMSPARCSDEDDAHCHGGSSGYSSESSQGWRQTPRRTPTSARRGGGRPVGAASYASGLAFCLSPLVRASPSRWHLKGMPSEMTVPGDSRVPPKTSAAVFFCKNRSRKLADLGRYSHNSTH